MCGPFQSDTRGSKEVGSRGGGRVIGVAIKPWINDAVDEKVKTITSKHYHREIYLRGSIQGRQVAGLKTESMVCSNQSLMNNICGAGQSKLDG